MAAIPQPATATQPAGARDSRFSRSFAVLFSIFAAELTLISLWRIPDSLAFGNFAFCDQGANLTVQYLIGHGYRPGFDFGYHYGLLPLLIARLWFDVFGLNPHAYLAGMLACNILFAWALARIFSVLNPGPLGLALTVITLGFAMQPTYPNAAHALETVLLVHALAQQARGARSYALALTAVAVFVKPSMAYILGFLLVLLILWELWRSRAGFSKWGRRFAPAASAAALCAVAVSGTFGMSALFRSAFPVQGAVAYHALDYGFFEGSGSSFWAAPGMPWFFYFIHVPGLWIAASIYLIGAAAAAARAIWESPGCLDENRARNEIILTCAFLHVAFILLLFGNQWSWFYYFYLPVIGVAASVDLGRWRRRGAVALCAMALLAWTATAHKVIRARETTAPYAETGGLYATRAEASEWHNVLQTVRSRRAVILYTKGSAELTFPEFEKPVTLYLDRGLMEPGEIKRKLVQLSSADFVVVPEVGQTCRGIPDAPEFFSAMEQFKPVWRGKVFSLYARPEGR